MKRILWTALVAAAFLVSCTETPVGLQSGGLALEVIVVQLDEPAAPAAVGEPDVAGSGGWAKQVASETVDSARVILSGPESRVVAATPGTTVTISDLEPGTYSAVLEAFQGDEVTWKGTVTGVSVVAGETTETTEVLLAPTEIDFIAIGERAQLNSPSGASWASTDASIVDVDDTGLLTAVSNGLAEVTGSLGNSTVSIAAVVSQQVDSVLVSPSGNTINPGETLQFSATAFDTAGVALNMDSVRVLWISSDHNVATIDQSGLATGTGGGTVTISASVSGEPGSAALTVNAAFGAAAQLAFVTQPENATAGASFPTAVQVAIQDGSGNTVTTASDPVTLSIDTNPGTGTLSGTLTVNAVNGVATFSGLSIDEAGTGYTLGAASGSLTGAVSAAFDVIAVVPTHLAFTVQPPATMLRSDEVVVQLEIRDAGGKLVKTANDLVTVSLGTNPKSATLGGITTVAAVGGVATFNGLTLDRGGVGYTFDAASGSLTGATSAAFDVGRVALLSNTTYVDYRPGNSAAEASNLEETWEQLEGSGVKPFTDISAAGFDAVLQGTDILAMPELENADLAPALSADAITSIFNFVDGGGTLVAHGTFSSRTENFLNTVFGFAIAPTGVLWTSYDLNASAATGTPFSGGPASLPDLSATIPLDETTLPLGASAIYEETVNASFDVAVALIPVGSGQIVYMGWDWFDAPPVGSAADGGWVDVLIRAGRF